MIRTAALLAALTFVLYLPGIGWGVPAGTSPEQIKTWATDEILPLEALAEMRNTLVESRADRNYGYPWWHYFVAASAQAPYLGYLKLTGGMSRPAPTYPFGLSDPVAGLRGLTIVGRLVSVAMTAGIVVAAYLFALTLWGATAGLIAAALVLTNYLLVYYGRTGNLDAPALFWTSLGLVALARILAQGASKRRAAALGLFAGLAMATKDQSVLIFAPIAVALLVPRFAPVASGQSRRGVVAAGLVASIAAYLVATGMVIDPARHLRHVQALLFAPATLAAGAVYFPPAPPTWAGRLHLGAEFIAMIGRMMSWPVLALALLGTVRLARSSPRLLVLLVPVGLLFLALVLPTGTVVRRYFLPMAFVLDAVAAYAIVWLGKRYGRPALAAAVTLSLGWRLLNGGELVASEYRDTRYPAARWLASHAKSGDRLEYFGVSDVLPALPAGVVARRIAGREAWIGDRNHGPAIRAYLATDGPQWIVSIPDWTSKPGMDRSADCPEDVCAELADGSLGYREAAYFPPCEWIGGIFTRPALDNPSVCPSVRIFARR